MLSLGPEASLAAIPKLLPASEDERRGGLDAIRSVLSASGELSSETARRFDRVTQLSGLTAEPEAKASYSEESDGGLDMSSASREADNPAHKVRSSDPPRRKPLPAAATIVVHPCDKFAARCRRSRRSQHHQAILVGPSAKIRAAACRTGIDISHFELIERYPPPSEPPRKRPSTSLPPGRSRPMKGSLHTDELMRSVTASTVGHVFVSMFPPIVRPSSSPTLR